MVERIRESYLENDEQVAKFETLFVEGQSLIWHRLNIFGLNHFARVVFNADFLARDVGEDEVNAGQRLLKGDLLLHEQVGTLALE